MLLTKWRNITIGSYADVNSLIRDLIDSGYSIGSWADDILKSNKFTLLKERKDIELFRVSPSNFGLHTKTLRKDIYEQALKAGLKLCPLKVGPQLRLQYPDQPKLESLQI